MARLGVRGTFSQPGPSHPAASGRLARTLGLTPASWALSAMSEDTPLRSYGPITTRFSALGSMYPCLRMIIGTRSVRDESRSSSRERTPEQVEKVDSFYLNAVQNLSLAVSEGHFEMPQAALDILDEYLRFAASAAGTANTQEAIREQICRAEQCIDRLQAFARSQTHSSEA